MHVHLLYALRAAFRHETPSEICWSTTGLGRVTKSCPKQGSEMDTF